MVSQHTVADRKRDAVAERAIFEAAQLRSDVSTVNAAVFICGKLKQRLEACELDKDWNKVFRSQLTGIEGVEPGNIELLVRYHTVLRKTSKGWTYARSVQEMVVTDDRDDNLSRQVVMDGICLATAGWPI